MPESVDSQTFLKTLWEGCEGTAELCVIGKKFVKAFPFTYPDSINSFVSSAQRHNKTGNVYYGVCLRSGVWKGGRGSEVDVVSAPALWADIDFPSDQHKGQTLTPDEARTRVAAFPLQPSAAVVTGGGVQLFWFLKEPAQGDGLKRLKSLNKAIAKYLGADTQAVDLARVLRLPGTLNRKYTPPKPSFVSPTGWFPDRRYTLDDFDDFLDIEPSASASPKQDSAGQSPEEPGQRQIPSKTIPDSAKEKLGDLFSKIWRDGSRHSFALDAAGAMAHAGISEEAAIEVVRRASNAVGGETEKRVKDVQDTYRRFQEGHKIAGLPDIEKTINEKFPPMARDQGLKVLSQIRRCLPTSQGKKEKDSPPSFTIKKFRSFPSDPALWYIQGITRRGEEFEVNCDTDTLIRYPSFQAAVFEQSYIMLSEMKQTSWRKFLGEAGKTVERMEAPREAKPQGAIESSLEDFVQDAKESPEETALKVFPGYDSEETYFRTEAFKRFLREQGHRIDEQILYHRIKELGWQTKTRRIGQRVIRVWAKAETPTNGQDPHALPKDLFSGQNQGSSHE